MSKNWTEEQIPSQEGKKIILTGANSGIGFGATKALSKKGAHVIMAVRNEEKGQNALKKIKKENPKANLELMLVDLADFQSIHSFSEEFLRKHDRLDILINNAGVMSPPERKLTKQGFELQFGVNHLGHFLLTGLLLDIIKQTPNSRIAVQSSLVHKTKMFKPDIHFDNLNWEKNYNKYHSYGQSKLANLLFAYELDRIFKTNTIDTIVTAAHPGYTKTNLQKDFFSRVILNNLFAQSIDMGALPILRAATEQDLRGSEYFGPDGIGEARGYPVLVESSDKSHDEKLAKKLWNVSEKLTNCTYNFS